MAENFDNIIDRLHSDSIKWNVFPEDVLPMWVADMDFLSPPAVINTLVERTQHGVFGYAAEPKDMDEIVIRWISNQYKMQVEPQHLLYVPGVVTGLNMASRAFLSPGDGLMFQTPIYPPFFGIGGPIDLQNHTVDLVQKTDGSYVIDFHALEKGLKKNTKMFLLCNPHNPVGRVFTRPELEQIAAFCSQHDLLLCSDEIHCDLIYAGSTHIPIMSLGEDIAQRMVMLIAPSKTFNIAGLGFSVMIIKNKDLMDQMKRTFSGILPHPDLLAVQAARAAYLSGHAWLQELISYLQGNRDYLYEFVRSELPGISMVKPEGTFLAWLDCRTMPFGDDPFSFFLTNAKVGLNNGIDFGSAGKGFVRLNFACPRVTLEEGLTRMQQAVQNYI
ncbi:MAG: MalY/PatB family protein [Anaerolineaceae bacterium]